MKKKRIDRKKFCAKSHVKSRAISCVMFWLLGALCCGAVQAQQAAAQQAAAQQAAVRQTAVRLNADEAVERAIKSNLSLESARISTGTKKRASDLSWNQFIPDLTITGSLSRDNEKNTISGTRPVPLDSLFTSLGVLPVPEAAKSIYGVTPYSVEAPQWHIAGSFQASLTLSIAMFENMKRLRLDYEGGQLGYEKAKTQLERDVRKAFNNMLLLQENINLLRESYEAAGRRVQMARANYNAGLTPELTLLQAQVAQENMKPAIDQAEGGFRLSMAQFAMNLGMDYDTPFELIPLNGEGTADADSAAINFISLDVKELISKAASGKPDIQELRHSIQMLHSGRKAQMGSLLPFLNLSWGSTSVFTGDPWKDSWGDKDWQKSGSLTIALGLRLHSLIPWSADFQAVKNLDDQIQTANIGLAQMIQGTEIEIYNTVLSLDRIRIAAEAQSQTISLAERSYRLTEEAYRAGLQDLLQVQNSALELNQAKVSMREQQFNYLNGLVDLEYAIGVPFGTLSSRGNAE